MRTSVSGCRFRELLGVSKIVEQLLLIRATGSYLNIHTGSYDIKSIFRLHMISAIDSL